MGLAAGPRRGHQDREGPQDDRELGYIPGKDGENINEEKESRKMRKEKTGRKNAWPIG